MSDNCNCGCGGEHKHYHAEEESKYDFVLREYAPAMSDNEVAAAVKNLLRRRLKRTIHRR